MNFISIGIQFAIMLAIGVQSSMSISNSGVLSECLIPTNCVKVEWSFANANKAFDQLVFIASSLPRTSTVESSKNYWHGIVRSLIFRFPDDLEILLIPSKNIVQVRSASRLGLGDLGVNQKRINSLYSEINKVI